MGGGVDIPYPVYTWSEKKIQSVKLFNHRWIATNDWITYTGMHNLTVLRT